MSARAVANEQVKRESIVWADGVKLEDVFVLDARLNNYNPWVKCFTLLATKRNCINLLENEPDDDSLLDKNNERNRSQLMLKFVHDELYNLAKQDTCLQIFNYPKELAPDQG